MTRFQVHYANPTNYPDDGRGYVVLDASQPEHTVVFRSDDKSAAIERARALNEGYSTAIVSPADRPSADEITVTIELTLTELRWLAELTTETNDGSDERADALQLKLTKRSAEAGAS